MSKTFRTWKIDEPLFLPPVVGDFVAKDHLALFVLSLVRDDLGLGEITGTYGSRRGQPPIDPTMMTALLLYSYCCGIYSSRRIAKACRERVDFMSIVALDAPDFRTVSDFRKRHLKALGDLFKLPEPVFGQIKQARAFPRFPCLFLPKDNLDELLVSLIDCYVVQLSQVFMLRVFPVGTNY